MKSSTTTSLKRLLAERLTHLRRIKELEEEAETLRQQRDAANAVIQELNRIIAGDVELKHTTHYRRLSLHWK